MSAIVSGSGVFVGLDYHQDSVQVCVLDRAGNLLMNRPCRNDAGAIVKITRAHCADNATVQAAIEACCGAADLAEEIAKRPGQYGCAAGDSRSGSPRTRSSIPSLGCLLPPAAAHHESPAGDPDFHLPL